MTHNMTLWPGPFKAIKKGYKDIEMRLNDERRKSIKEGDIIIFTNTETKETLKAEVLSIHPYKNFAEIYKAYPKRRLGYRFYEKADPKDMLKYYPQERIDEYGALAIVIKVVK